MRHPARGLRTGLVLGLAAAASTVVLAAPAAAAGSLSVSNPDGLPYNDRFVTSRVGTTLSNGTTYHPHDIATVGFHNGTSAAVQVTRLGLTGPFRLASTVRLPATIAAGGTLSVGVRFVATGGAAAQSGSLVASTSSRSQPTLTASLEGAWSASDGGSAEPSLVNLVYHVFGYKIPFTYSGQNLDLNGKVQATGDERLSPFWYRASTAAPVTVRQIAAYSGYGSNTLYYYPASSTAPCLSTSTQHGSCTAIETHSAPDSQTVLPKSHTGGPTYASFSPSVRFGWNIGGGDYSDDARNNKTNDYRHGCTGACGHHVRLWPLSDRYGHLVANSYVLTVDTGGVNFDYQDDVYLVTNVRPAS